MILEKKFDGFPFNIGWELTLACNLRCSHCASAAGLIRENELTTEEALSICDQFPKLLVQEVDLTGGEPLLREDWFDIALYLKNLEISVNILTNGLIVSPQIVNQMKIAGIRNVGISLDGLKKVHDQIRCFPGSYDKVIESIKLIQAAKINFIVITTVNNLNIQQLPEIYDMLKSMGVKNWRLQPVIPIGRVLNFKELELNANGILQLGDFLQKFSHKSDKQNMKLICSDGLQYIPGTMVSGRTWRGCSAGWVTCGITSDGKIKGCLSLPDDIIDGDLRKQDLWEIWFHSESFSYARHFSEGSAGSNCLDCNKAIECKGGCSANSIAATGRFHNDPYCYYKLEKQMK